MDKQHDTMEQVVKAKASKVIKFISIFLLLSISMVGIAVLGPLETAMNTFAQNIKKQITAALIENGNFDVEYDTLEPEIFNRIVIKNLKILRKDRSEFAAIDKLVLEYNLVSIVQGKKEDLITDITVDRLTLSSVKNDIELLKTEQGAPISETVENIIRFLQGSINIRITNSDLNFTDGQLSYQLRLSQFSSLNTGGELKKFYQTDGSFSIRTKGKTLVSAKALVEARIVNDVADLNLQAIDVRTDFLRLNRLNLNAKIDRRGIIIKKGIDDNNFDLNWVYSFEKNELIGYLAFDKVRIDNYLNPIYKYSLEKTINNVSVTGQVNIKSNLDSRTLVYDSKLEAIGVFQGKSIHASAILKGDLDHLDIDKLVVTNHILNLEASGQLFKGGKNNSIKARASYSLDEDGDTIAMDSEILSSDFRSYVVNAQLYLNQVKFGDTRVLYNSKTENFKVDTFFSSILSDSSRLNLQLEKGILAVSAKFESSEKFNIDHYKIRNERIHKSLSNLTTIKFKADAETKMDLTGVFKMRDSVVDIRVNDMVLKANQTNDGTNTISYQFDSNSFSNQGRLELSFLENFISVNLLTKENLKLSLNYNTINGDIEFSGPYGLFITLSKYNNVYAGNYRVEALTVDYQSLHATASTFGTIQFEDFENWRILSPSLSLDLSFIVNNKKNNILFNSDFELSSKEVRVNDIVISYLGDYFSGSIFLDYSKKSKCDFNLGLENRANGSKSASDAETIAWTGSIDLTNNTFESTYLLNNLNLKKTNISDFTGFANSKGSIGGSLNDPSIRMAVSSKNMFVGPTPVNLTFNMKYEKVFELTDLNFRLLNYNMYSKSISLSLDESRVAGDLRFNLTGSKDFISSDFVVFYSKNTEQSHLNIRNFPNYKGEKTDFWLVGDFVDKGWQWIEKSGAIVGIIHPNNRFVFAFNQPFLFSGGAEGTISSTAIDVTLSKIGFDISVLKDFLNLGYLSFTNGNINGNVRIRGLLFDPSFYGNIVLLDLRGKMLLNNYEIKSKKINVAIEDKTIYLLDFTIENNNSLVKSSGFLQLQKYEISKWQIVFNPSDENGLYLNYNFGPIFIEGYASGNIALSGDSRRTAITGSILLSNSLISMAEVKPTAPKQEMQSTADQGDLALDLTLTTAKNVTFQYPNTAIPLIRSNFDRNQTLKISFDTGLKSFQMTGVTNIKGGEIFDFKRSFFIKNAQVVFNETSDSFDPKIDLLAESRLSLNKKTYKLILTIDKQRLSNLSPTVVADPFLNQNQITALLSGQDPDSDTNLTLGDLLSTGADLFSSIGILRSFENTIRNFINVDVFSIRTGLIPSLIKEAVEEKPLDNQAFSFGKYFDNTSLLIGKFITDDMYAEVLTQIKTIEQNQVDTSGLGVKLDFEFSIQWALPFVDLEWRFSPTSVNDLFLRDNAFTFSWRIQ